MERIVLEVDDATGEGYRSFSPENKKDFNLTMSLLLKKMVNDRDMDNYKKFLDKVGRKAESNGLTPEILAELLRTDD